MKRGGDNQKGGDEETGVTKKMGVINKRGGETKRGTRGVIRTRFGHECVSIHVDMYTNRGVCWLIIQIASRRLVVSRLGVTEVPI